MDPIDNAGLAGPNTPFPIFEKPLRAARNSHQDDYLVHSTEDELDEDDKERETSANNSSGQDEAVFDDMEDSTGNSSPRTSHNSQEDISELIMESRDPSFPSDQVHQSLYTPVKRSPFRNASSVRAIQLDTTPPHLYSLSSPQQRYRLDTSSRNNTPRSTRSHFSNIRSPSKLSTPKKVVKENPLVLLHVTILPIHIPYSQDILEGVLPSSTLLSWRLLREKACDTLLERGILIPHPREDYDLLEERLLESLELQIPRILKCGHFHLDPETAVGIEEEESDYDSDTDADICDDCGRRIRDGRQGSGTGNKRWDIKIFAANGLMRAGAWSAAWREMERVDVEIMPWIEDSLRREMDARREEERITISPEVVEEEKEMELDHERLREIYGDDAQAFVDGLDETTSRPGRGKRRVEVPLWTLFSNYIHVLLLDRRNICIFLLSILVMFMATRAGNDASNFPHPSSQMMPPAVSLLEESKVPNIGAATPSLFSKLSEPTGQIGDLTSVAAAVVTAHASEHLQETVDGADLEFGETGDLGE